MLGLLMVFVLLCAGTVCWALVSVSTAHQRARVSADLAALAAAQSDCARAEVVARANATRLDACTFAGADAIVTVSVEGPRVLGPWSGSMPRLRASARAGPG